jgi:hypothetical protein
MSGVRRKAGAGCQVSGVREKTGAGFQVPGVSQIEIESFEIYLLLTAFVRNAFGFPGT